MSHNMRFLFIVFLAGLLSISSVKFVNAQNLYWVNGSGEWNDPSHWSLTSGGEPANIIPGKENSVIFDTNSFTSENQIVLLKNLAECKDLTWKVEDKKATLKSKSFLFKSNTKAQIEIYGSICIDKTLQSEYYGNIVLKSNRNEAINVNSNLHANVLFDSDEGNYKLENDFNTDGNLELISGKFTSNNKGISCNEFIGSGSNNRAVDFGNSEITVNKWNFEETNNLDYKVNDFKVIVNSNSLGSNLKAGNLPINAATSGSKAPFVVYPVVTTNVKCNGGTDGTLTMSVEGGTKPYTYSVRNNTTSVTTTFITSDTLYTFNGLTAADYYARVEHAGGGVFGDTYTISQPSPLTALAPTVTVPLTCFNSTDGEITANQSGGTGPYTYQWHVYVGPGPNDFNLLVGETNQALSNIGQGIYRVEINDANNCGAGGTVFVDYPFIKPPRNDGEIPPEISFNSYNFTEECGGTSDGTITISASGGVGDMDYYLFGQTDGLTYPIVIPPYDEDGVFTGLSAQTYETYAVDANGCIVKGNDIVLSNYDAPTADAGSNEETCEEVPFDLSTATIQASATNYSSLLWDDGGAPGTFSDATAIHPIYTPAVGQTGVVTLTLTANGNGDCPSVNDNMTLTIKANSIAPTSATVNNNNYCPGDFPTITLTYVGGFLGTAATAEWYSDAAFTVPVGSGQNIVIAAPAVTTTYYVRFEGDCNNTTAASVTVTVKTESTNPTGINSSNTNFCPGNSTDLTVQGGSLGTGATWEWYSGSCGGTPVGSGPSITVSPASTTTYYVRAEGDCNTTACVNFIVDVKTESVAPTGATSNRNNFCPGDFPNIRLSYVGGTLGDGATAEWYSDPGFTTNIGSGQNLLITPAPSVTTTYYVRFEGDCNITAAASVTVTVKTESTDPTGINTDNDNFCPGESANLTVQGGSLGTAATWEWYTGNCGSGGSTLVGSGATINVSPVVTTTYYVRAEGDCNNTNCATITLTVNTESTDPTGINTDNDNFCPGQSANLTVQGGSLGLGASWEWYSGSCGGTPVGSGAGITVSPTTTTTYYVRAEGTCNTTACASVVITVKTESVAPTSATVDNNNFCPGDFPNITLSYVGGTLGTGATAEWYSDAAFTVPVGSGQDLVIPAPAVTTTYYVRFEGDCNNTTGASIQVIVKTQSTNPTGINSSNTNFCPGSSTDLTVQGGSLGTGASWEWYSGSCGGTPVGSGPSITVSPASTTTYYVRAEGDCNNTACANITITVKTESVAPTSATVNNNDFCPGDFANITLSYVGGTLGDGATAEWYSDATFTTNVGSGQNLVIPAPAVTTTYYVRFEGDCNTTTAASVTVTIKTESVAPTAASVDNNNFCAGTVANITLSYTGGSLGDGATAEWYSDATYTTNVGSGQNLVIPAPAVTTTYYVRFEGDCNNTANANVTVTVFQNPTANIIPASPVTTCTLVDQVLDGNPTPGSSITFVSHVWTGADLSPLDDPNIQAPTFNTATPGTYNFTYTVTDDNGCLATDAVTVNVNESATAYAGIDTLLCYGSDYHILDADSSFCNGIFWTTDGGDGSFDNNAKIDPIYTPGPADLNAGSVKLVLNSVGIAPCANVTDTMEITFLPELIVSIGKPSPYLIDSTSAATPTHINVSLKITGHSFSKTLAVYLVSPKDSVVELKPKCTSPFTGSWLSDVDYEFYNDAEDTSGIMVIDECIANSGRYEFSGEWKGKLHGQDPANGAWRIRIVDTHPWGSPGVLDEAEIMFLDYNVDGLLEPVTYFETGIGLNINQKTGTGPDAVTDYAIPISGITTSCFGLCDATAIATAIGGDGNYTYEWSTLPDFSTILETNDTVELCAGTYYVRVTDGHPCSAVTSVVVGEPDKIEIVDDYVKHVSCIGGASGEIMLELTGGTGVSNLSYTHDGGTTWFASGDTIKNLTPDEYTLTIRDLSGCTKDTTITINDALEIQAGFTVVYVSCDGNNDGEITSTPVNGTAPFDFEWSTGFIENNVNSSTITGLAAGNYSVTITDDNGCVLIDDTTLINPNALYANATARNSFCIDPRTTAIDTDLAKGEIIVYASGGSGSYNYSWTGPGAFTSNNDTISALDAGSYVLTLSDSFGCSKDTTINIADDPSHDLYNLNVTVPDLSICWYEWVKLNGTYTGTIADSIFVQGLRDGGAAFDTTVFINSDNPFSDSIRIDANSRLQIIRVMNDYCMDNVYNIQLTYTPDFNLDILDNFDGNAFDDTIYLKSENETILQALTTTTTGLTFEWSPIDYLESPFQQVTKVTPEESIRYKVVVESDDCMDSTSIYLEYIPAITPNDGFTPNGDGINDLWKIKYIGKFPNNVVTVYNRWGVKVYEQKGYDDKDETKMWDGKSKSGKDLSSGTYYYIILLNEPGFDPITGPITIVR